MRMADVRNGDVLTGEKFLEQGSGDGDHAGAVVPLRFAGFSRAYEQVGAAQRTGFGRESAGKFLNKRIVRAGKARTIRPPETVPQEEPRPIPRPKRTAMRMASSREIP
jgi:hypothetical protein